MSWEMARDAKDSHKGLRPIARFRQAADKPGEPERAKPT